MIVYIVIDNEEQEFCGVFSTQDKAQAWIDNEVELGGDSLANRYSISAEEVL